MKTFLAILSFCIFTLCNGSASADKNAGSVKELKKADSPAPTMTEKCHPRTIDIYIPEGDEDSPHLTRPTGMPVDIEEESEEGTERRRPCHDREHYIDVYASDHKPTHQNKRVVNNIDIDDMRVSVHWFVVIVIAIENGKV